MSAADIYFLPSRWEGIAISFFEAMSCGLPVVGADVGGQRLIKRSNTEEESEQYCKILKELIMNTEKRILLGRKSRERICNHFTIDKMGEKIKESLNKAKDMNINYPRPQPTLEFASNKLVMGIEFLRITRGLPDLYSNRNDTWIKNQVDNGLRYNLFKSINYLYEPFYKYAKKGDGLGYSPMQTRSKK